MKLSNIFKKKITVVIIPHSVSRPLRSSVSSFIIFFLFFIWFGSLSWAIWIISKQVNYDEALKNNLLLKEKASTLTNTVSECRDYIEKVKEMEKDLSAMLNLKSKKEIIESPGIGGPSNYDRSILAQLLNSDADSIHSKQVEMNINEIRKDSWQTTQGYKEIKDFITDERNKLLATPCILPIIGNITSRFGWRVHPLSRGKEFHEGLDISNEKETPIRATADGRVIFSGWQGSYGRAVIVDHGYGFTTRYCHCCVLISREGETVKRGQIIALVGTTGRSTGEHLHYEVW